MARAYAPLKSSIWTNRDFCALSSSAQRVYLLAMSQPNISWAGVVPFTEKRWASFAPDTTRGAIAEAVNELVDRGFVMLDDDTEELWIRSFVKHNRILEQPQLRKKAVGEAVTAVVSHRLRAAVLVTMPDDVKAQVISGGAPLTEPPQEALTAGDVSLDLDLQPEPQQGEGPLPWRSAALDLMPPKAAPPLIEEAEQVLASFGDAYPIGDVELAVQRLLDGRRRFPFPSNLRTALANLLGPPKAQPQASPLDDTARAARRLEADGNQQTAALREVKPDPALNASGIASARSVLRRNPESAA